MNEDERNEKRRKEEETRKTRDKGAEVGRGGT
jgi:hypothetical protein